MFLLLVLLTEFRFLNLVLVVLFQCSAGRPIQNSVRPGFGDRDETRTAFQDFTFNNWNSDFVRIKLGTSALYSPNRIFFPDDLRVVPEGTGPAFPQKNSLGRDHEIRRTTGPRRVQLDLDNSRIVFRSLSEEVDRDSLEVPKWRRRFTGHGSTGGFFRLAYWSLFSTPTLTRKGCPSGFRRDSIGRCVKISELRIANARYATQ